MKSTTVYYSVRCDPFYHYFTDLNTAWVHFLFNMNMEVGCQDSDICEFVIIMDFPCFCYTLKFHWLNPISPDKRKKNSHQPTIISPQTVLCMKNVLFFSTGKNLLFQLSNINQSLLVLEPMRKYFLFLLFLPCSTITETRKPWTKMK